MRRSFSSKDKRQYMKMFFKGASSDFCEDVLSKDRINKEIAKSLEIAYDALKIIQQPVWCEHDKS